MREKEVVKRVTSAGGMFTVTAIVGEESEEVTRMYSCRSMIIASGMGMFEPSRLKVPGENELDGRGVFYSVPNLDIYRGKRVLVVGGGDTAVENAVGLAGVCDVTLLHRRDSFRATEANLDLLSTSPVKKLTPFVVEEILGSDYVTGVILRNSETEEKVERPFDAVIINVGFSPDLSIIDEVGVENDGNHIIIKQNDMCTNVEGIFACGDIVSYPGKVRQVHPALGEAATAAMAAYKYIKKPYWAKEAEK
jgi:thioredoxin reductase (NADPH)